MPAFPPSLEYSFPFPSFPPRLFFSILERRLGFHFPLLQSYSPSDIRVPAVPRHRTGAFLFKRPCGVCSLSLSLASTPPFVRIVVPLHNRPFVETDFLFLSPVRNFVSLELEICFFFRGCSFSELMVVFRSFDPRRGALFLSLHCRRTFSTPLSWLSGV